MKIAVSSQGPSAGDPFDQRFARAPYLLVYDTQSETWSSFDNTENREAQSGAGIGAATKVAELGASVVVTGRVGPKAEQALGRRDHRLSCQRGYGGRCTSTVHRQ